MNSKLTLRLDEDLIQSAKSYSAKTGKSVSKIVKVPNGSFELTDYPKSSGKTREKFGENWKSTFYSSL